MNNNKKTLSFFSFFFINSLTASLSVRHTFVQWHPSLTNMIQVVSFSNIFRLFFFQKIIKKRGTNFHSTVNYCICGFCCRLPLSVSTQPFLNCAELIKKRLPPLVQPSTINNQPKNKKSKTKILFTKSKRSNAFFIRFFCFPFFLLLFFGSVRLEVQFARKLFFSPGLFSAFSAA